VRGSLETLEHCRVREDVNADCLTLKSRLS